MTHDQLLGWILVAAIANVGAWATIALYVRNLRSELSQERLRNASLRERLEPVRSHWLSYRS